MGIRAVRAAFEVGADLRPRAALLLVFMASQCRDSDRPPRYFGGHDALARALGYRDLPTAEEARRAAEAGDDKPRRQRAQVLRTVRDLLADLTDDGSGRPPLVCLLSSARPGRTAEYALLFGGLMEVPNDTSIDRAMEVPGDTSMGAEMEVRNGRNGGPKPALMEVPNDTSSLRPREVPQPRARAECRECRRPAAAPTTVPDDWICIDCRKGQPA